MLKSRDHIHILIDTHILKYVTYISLSGTKLVRLVMLHNQVPFLDPSDSNVAIFRLQILPRCGGKKHPGVVSGTLAR